jgi:hypothetical protein
MAAVRSFISMVLLLVGVFVMNVAGAAYHQAQHVSYVEGAAHGGLALTTPGASSLPGEDVGCSLCQSARSFDAPVPPLPLVLFLAPVGSTAWIVDAHPWVSFAFGAFSSRAPPSNPVKFI